MSYSRKIYQTSLKFDWRDKNLEDVLFNGILREMAKDKAQNNCITLKRDTLFKAFSVTSIRLNPGHCVHMKNNKISNLEKRLKFLEAEKQRRKNKTAKAT